jgi:O-acetyl-ADP-ribose deacetylase (regulator of RNase III)
MPRSNATGLRARVEVWEGNITTLTIDAIVNAANSSLLGGSGVDGAIHRAAGPGLVEECRLLGGCKTGQAKITAGHRLKARQVIHTVGPVWRGGQHGEEALLENCYIESLKLCLAHKIGSVAFPGISSGIFGYPIEAAAAVATRTVLRFLHTNDLPRSVVLCTFSGPATEAMSAALEYALGDIRG